MRFFDNFPLTHQLSTSHSSSIWMLF